MPNFKSIHGKLEPAHERVALTNKGDDVMIVDGKTINPGEPFIYDGPDRAAVEMLHEQGVEHLGTDFRDCSEFQDFINAKYQGDVEKYFKRIGFDEEKSKAEQINRTKDVKSHADPEKKKEELFRGGGRDTTGNADNDLVGGFGEPRTRSPKEIKK